MSNLIPLIGTGHSSYDNGDDIDNNTSLARQFINPSSSTELWWPSDIKQIQIRPALDVMIKSGMAAYVLAGIEVRVPPEASGDGNEWKNYGINSQILADQWTTFNVAVEDDFRVECFLGEKKIINSLDEDLDVEWKSVDSWGDINDTTTCDLEDNVSSASTNTLRAIQILGEVIANLDDSSPLADGMHIVSIPVQDKWLNLPPPKWNEDDNENPSKSAYKISCVATSESNAKEILSLDEGLLSLSATSLLRVDLISVSPGSESEYLPEVYKPLYGK